MKESTCREWIDNNIKDMMWATGLMAWKIRFIVEELEPRHEGETRLGTCDSDYAYEDACITINNEGIRDEAHLEKVIRHELLHLVIAPYESLAHGYLQIVDDQHVNAFREMERIARERTVLNLERMLDWAKRENPYKNVEHGGHTLLTQEAKEDEANQ
ncbi:MAG: hypothetical protein AAFU78_19215 [Cyanobacteria bacterium J06633_2]